MKIDAETLKKQVILHLPYLLFLLVFAKLGEAVRLAPGADASQKLLGLSEGFALAFQNMWPGAAMDWLIGLCGAAIMRLAVYLRGKDAKKYRKNVEYGSARWGNKADIAPFMDPKPENNIILTQSEGLMLNGRPKNPANARNKNVLVVGGSGSGKTRFFIKPNLMQMHSSYVVTDPKGTVLVECGKMLQRGTPKLDKDGKPMRNEKGKARSPGMRVQKWSPWKKAPTFLNSLLTARPVRPRWPGWRSPPWTPPQTAPAAGTERRHTGRGADRCGPR